MKSKLLFFLVTLIIQKGTIAQETGQVDEEIKRQTEYALELCKTLHQNPELSFQEFETAERMASELEKSGFEVTKKIGGNSVVGVLRNGEGPTVMLRTDLDALPIEEKTGFGFASTKKTENTDGKEVSVMHACGHDIHMSMWIGAIHALAAMKDQWKGTLLVIGQQAEEFVDGAGKAIEDGLFTKFPVPDYALAFHVNPELETGTIGLNQGPVFAGTKALEITVYGKGGHGAIPEHCIDPIVIASRIVLDLQTIVSREISPLDPAVITVGSIHGGTRSNIIPDEVKMELTLRYYSDEVIEKMTSSISRICKSAAQMAGMPDGQLPKIRVAPNETPPVLNDPGLTEKVHGFASGTIGTENILKTPPMMGAEDFAKYGRTPEKVPICMIWVGCTGPNLMKTLKERGEKPFPLHSSYFSPDYEKTIETGIKVMVGNVIGLTGN